MKKRVCAAAVCAAFSLSAFAQSALDQARTPAGMAAIDRAQSTGFLAGLERAMKTPLEIVWLRASAEESLWNDPALSRTAAVGRTAWRYVFGGNAQFAPRPNEIARLVVSTLNFPSAPISAGRLDLTGTGRLYLVTPEAPSTTPPDRLAMILAAGSTLHISDASSPSIHIELKAPENRPLLLGNLAASDIGKVLSLLVKPSNTNAFEASVEDGGKVALRAGGEVQLAAILPDTALKDLRVTSVQQPKGPTDQVLIASLSPLESPMKQSGFDQVVVASLAAQPGEADARPRTGGTQRGQVGIDVQFTIGEVAGVMENRSRAEDTLFASLAASGFQTTPARNKPATRTEAVAEPRPELAPIASVADAPVAVAREERTIVASLAPAISAPETKALVKLQSALLEAKTDFSAELSAVAASVEGAQKKAVPTQLAALSPATGALEFKASSNKESTAPERAPSASPDLARMRAEVEAEIARERERLAAQFKPQVIGAPAPKRFVLGV